jgi:hypothetical protein
MKSFNVLLALSGIAKLCDFGGGVQLLTSIASSASAAGGEGAAVTLSWRAPEMFSGVWQAAVKPPPPTCTHSASSCRYHARWNHFYRN